MSNFPQNLSILRRAAGYTQESLAEALGVSRQAVSKWESGATLPEASTLLTLAELLHCTLDQLMREELSEATAQAQTDAAATEEESERARFDLFVLYDTHMDRFSRMMAGGVALVLVGIGLLLSFWGLFGENPIMVLPFFLCLAGAVFLFIFGGIAYSDFQKAHPSLPAFYSPEASLEFQRRFRTGIAVAVAVILVDVGAIAVLGALFEYSRTMLGLSLCVFFLVLGAAVGTLVHLGIQYSKYQLDKYNKEAARAARIAKAKDSPLSGVIMSLATILFLYLGFVHQAWHPGWIVFPIGGILCGAVENIRKG